MGPIDPSDVASPRQLSQRHNETANDLVLGQLTGNKGPAPGLLKDRRTVRNRRREKSIHAFLYGNFRPRRRNSRRKADEHQYIFDWHEPHLLYTALAIVLLSCTDALFTLNLLNIGAVEANAVMNTALEVGVEQFLGIKISMTIISVLALVFSARRQFMGRFQVIRILQVICVGYVALIAYEIFLVGQILGQDLVTLASTILQI